MTWMRSRLWRFPISKSVGSCAGRHLDRARAKRLINRLVGDDGDAPVHDRQDGIAAHEVAVALVVRIDRDSGIAQDRLGRVVATVI